ENCQHRPVQYLNNVLEQDHRAIKRRVNASQHFRSFWAAWRTIAGYEAIHMDPQRPSVLECSGDKGRSTAPLHSSSVRGDELNCDILPRFSPRLQTCNTSLHAQPTQTTTDALELL